MKPYLVKIEDVSKRYLKDKIFNLEIKAGDLIILTGENGSGKTTLLKLILGLIFPSRGKIIYKDYLKISYLPEKIKLPEYMIVKNYIDDFKYDYIENYDKEFFENLNIPQNIKISKLSKGNKQKLSILKTLSTLSNLYILDEPLTSLDKDIIKIVVKKIEKEKLNGSSFIISTHNKKYFKKLNPTEVILWLNILGCIL